MAAAFAVFVVGWLATAALLGFKLIGGAGAAWTARALRQMGTGVAPQAA